MQVPGLGSAPVSATAATSSSWARELEKGDPLLHSYRNSVHEYYKRRNERLKTPKVVQLDADLLDEQLAFHLKSQFKKIFSFVDGLTLERFEPEVTLVIDTLLYWLSVRTMNRTYGQRLLGIVYRNEHNVEFEQDRPRPTSRQKALYGVFNVLGKWAMTRFTLWNWSEAYNEQTPDQRRVLIAAVSFAKALRLLSVLNFICFIYEGRYKTLVDRVLGLRVVTQHWGRNMRGIQAGQAASYEFMNKQLMWNEFGEFLNFVVPMLKASTINTWIEDIFFKKTNTAIEGAKRQWSTNVNCPLCDAAPATPYRTNCGHVFCYFCIKSKTMATSDYNCPICDVKVTRIIPA